MGLHAKMTALADAIREKSGVFEPMGLDAMCQTVQGLHTFMPPISGAADPDEVYRTTRPLDWLPMPTPNDHEMFFLGHLMEGVDNQFLIKLVFSGTCVVEFGNLVNGVFTAKEAITPVSNTMFYHNLNYDDYGDETEEGYRQYLVRITGDRITSVYGGDKAEDTPAYIVDFVCGIPLQYWSTNGAQGNYVWNKTFIHTRYIRFTGNGTPGGTTYGFMYCNALEAIDCQVKSNSDYSTYLFMNCMKLRAISENIFTNKKITMARMFRYTSIPSLPKMSVSATDVSAMFANSYLELYEGSKIDTSSALSFAQMFQDCYNLRSVKNLNISAMTNCSNLFANCFSLQEITFAGDTTPGGFTISLTKTVLSHKALVNMINSLPTATAAATITITGNPGANQLTDAEIAVATAKNWTITI